ncbi:MAG: hypothetical protein SO010_03400 [Candidatus Limiplasma sp.]|nr:hypothetical protein [Clostridiales bacterium]MDY3242645.1 hypothetical protein [Candidatus Limiplasma sp.]MDY4061940.1 hypothetical protein [Candidatus Limiplasma sp.]
MPYRAVVVDYAPKTRLMAAEAEKKANEMEREGWELVTFAVTNSAKGILIFRTAEEKPEE